MNVVRINLLPSVRADPRAPAWNLLIQARSADEFKTWLKSELMIAFHRGVLPADAVTEVFEHFRLAEA